MRNKLKSALFALISAVGVLAILYLSAAIIWILITDRNFASYFVVLSSIMKRGGTYSTMLAAIVAAVAFQSFRDAETRHKETENKIEQIGQYTIAFQLEEKQSESVTTCGSIIALANDNDYTFEGEEFSPQYNYFPIQFLTSGKDSTNLQCIMAFENDYFEKMHKKIIRNYYDFCERLVLPNPLYCAARQTNPELNCEKRNRFINLFLHIRKNEKYKYIWISAITDLGFLLLIKAKVKLTKTDNGIYCRLISQFSHSTENGKIRPLYY